MLTWPRAQFGTTKYCSAYLRNEQCQNRNCMFLHEPGEEKDSFTRQDLSSMNVASTQHQQSAFMPAQPPPQAAQPVAAATRPDSTGPLATPSEPAAPALPSSASWASKPHPPSRSVSRAAGAAASPALTNATTVSSSIPETAPPPPAQPANITSPTSEQPLPPPPPVPERSPFAAFVERILSRSFAAFEFDNSRFSEDENRQMRSTPCLIDPFGGRKRRFVKTRIEEERRRQLGMDPSDDASEQQHRGSLQLGGELESNQANDPEGPFSVENDLSQLSLINRGMTPTQQQLLQRFRSSPTPSAPSQQFAGQPGP